jgi:hypothetical protein
VLVRGDLLTVKLTSVQLRRSRDTAYNVRPSTPSNVNGAVPWAHRLSRKAAA